MSKLVLIIGIILMVISFPILFLGIAGTENPTVERILQSSVCRPPEKIVQVIGPYEYDSFDNSYGQSITFYCEIEPGQRRDVTLPAVGIIGGAFVVPFVLGLMMVIAATSSMTRRAARNYSAGFTPVGPFGNTQPSTVIDLRGNSGEIPPHAQKILENVFGNAFNWATTATNPDSLSEKLTQLQDARDKGLISEEEYQRVRQAILDTMDD